MPRHLSDSCSSFGPQFRCHFPWDALTAMSPTPGLDHVGAFSLLSFVTQSLMMECLTHAGQPEEQACSSTTAGDRCHFYLCLQMTTSTSGKINDYADN